MVYNRTIRLINKKTKMNVLKKTAKETKGKFKQGVEYSLLAIKEELEEANKKGLTVKQLIAKLK